MNMRRFSKAAAMAFCGALACCLLLLAGCSQASSSAASTASGSAGASAANTSATGSRLMKADAIGPYASGIHHATLSVEGYDPITIELDADAAPASVANFCTLANEGYYDGLTFYRFVDGFCMQGGTKGNSSSGSDTNLDPIVGEFSTNGYDNPLANEFKRGIVAMARTSDPNSARSTFFITLGTSENVSLSLDGQYAAFGTIDEAGMKTVDDIVADHLADVDDRMKGTISDEGKQAKIESIKIVD